MTNIGANVKAPCGLFPPLLCNENCTLLGGLPIRTERIGKLETDPGPSFRVFIPGSALRNCLACFTGGAMQMAPLLAAFEFGKPELDISNILL